VKLLILAESQIVRMAGAVACVFRAGAFFGEADSFGEAMSCPDERADVILSTPTHIAMKGLRYVATIRSHFAMQRTQL
jgi:hypothetical protein